MPRCNKCGKEMKFARDEKTKDQAGVETGKYVWWICINQHVLKEWQRKK